MALIRKYDKEKRREYYIRYVDKIKAKNGGRFVLPSREKQRIKNVRIKQEQMLRDLDAIEDYNKNFNALYLDTPLYEFDISKYTNPKRPYHLSEPMFSGVDLNNNIGKDFEE